MKIKLSKLNQILIFILPFFLFVQITASQQPTKEQFAAKVDEYMYAALKFDQFTGQILIAKDGVPIVSRGYGMANFELNVPTTPQTVYRIASLTKQFTSMAIMQLQERRELSVNDGICKYLENCPAAWQPVTIHHLLTHTSGIKNYTSLADWDEKYSTQSFTREELVDLFRHLPLEFSAGEKFKYSNSGYFLLGLIIEKASGETYSDFLKKNIFLPLGMKNTMPDNSGSIIKNRASGYDWAENSFINAAYLDMKTVFSEGNLVSTTEDLLLWDKSLYTEKLVSQKSLDLIFTPFKNEYAYGWRIRKLFGLLVNEHSGDINGFSAFISRFPSEKVTIIALSNSKRTSAGKVGQNLAAIIFNQPYKLPEPQLFDILWTEIVDKGIASAIDKYRQLKRLQPEKHDFREEMLNRLGYDLLSFKRLKEAVEIFKLNVEMFPNSANAYDSLGEAYFMSKNYESALTNYKKSLELDSQNNNARDFIKKIEEFMKK